MELLVVAAEASADLHGAAVLRELKELIPGLRAFGSAGPFLREAGCEALVRVEDLSVMGIAEVLPALPRVLDAMDTLADAARDRRPAAALLIDSPDFNLRLAEKLRRRKIPVVYFIGPSVWAWRTWRVRQIARDVQRMLVILPFEAAFYAQHGVAAIYVGNPVADRLRLPPSNTNLRRELGLREDGKVLAILPGSRKQELARLWEPMIKAAELLHSTRPDLQIVIPIAPTLDRSQFPFAPSPLRPSAPLFISGRAPEVLAASDAAIVASGTATLEAALAGVPTVVVYKLSWLSYAIGRLLVRAKFISLVNLLAGRALVPELLQRRCTPELIAEQAAPLLDGGPAREAQLEGMRRLREELAPANSPHAARRAAAEVAEVLSATRLEIT